MFRILHYSLILIFSLLLGNLSAQISISGKVVDGNGEPVEGAIVTIYESDTITTIDYAITATNGGYELSTTYRKAMIVEASSFGYEEAFMPIAVGSGNQSDFDFELIEKSFELSEVTVSADEIGVSQKGDTLTFHIEQFTTGAERNLGDVLNRLPGLEIRDGSVFYNNEKITKLLVQGRDIIGANQKLAVEGIRADQIKDIKILQNYKEDDQKLETGESENVAMDVNLKESELNKWSGSAKVLGGYPSSYSGEVTAFSLNEKVGMSGFARLNNVGEQSISWQDIRSMTDQGGGRFVYNFVSNDNIIPAALVRVGEEVQRNIDGAAVMNFDINASKNLNVKGFLLGAYAERESTVSLKQDYYTQDQDLNQTTNDVSKTPFGATYWRMTWDPDTSTIVKVQAPFIYNQTSDVGSRFGTLSNKDFNSGTQSEFTNFKFHPKLNVDRKLGELTTWYNQINYGISKEDGYNYFNDEFQFFNLPINQTEEFYELRQNKIYTTQSIDAVTSTKTKWKNNFFVEPIIEYHYNILDMDYDADQDASIDFSTDDYQKESTAAGKLRFGLESTKWEIKPSIAYYLLNRRTSETVIEESYPSFSIDVTRIFNRAHRLSFNSGYGFNYASFNSLNRSFEVINTSSFSRGGFSDYLIPQKSFNANVNYNKYNPIKSLWMYAGGSYSYVTDVLSSYSNFIENYKTNAYLITPNSQSASLWGGFGTTIKNVMRTRLNLDGGYSDGFSVGNGGDLSKVQRLDYGLRMRLNSDWEFPLNVGLGFSYGEQYQFFESGASVKTHSINPEIEVEFKLGQFYAEIEYGYDVIFAPSTSSRLHVLDVEFTYKLKESPFSFLVRGSNLLNIEPTEQISTSFTDEYIQTRAYTIFPGYVIGGVSFEF